MVSDCRALYSLVAVLITWSFLTKSFSHAAQRDIKCLKSIKNSLEDPNNYLSTWNFANTSEGSLCRFTGVDCWHPDENKILNIRLVDMGLRGEFPLGVSSCSSLTGLDLSSNNIYGNIPNNISKLIGFLTILDLSNNKLSGEIPEDIANCTYLNTLKLDNNRLTGQIPYQIGHLSRLRTFSVTSNQLSGPVPRFTDSTFTADSYENNRGLCGGPLPRCRDHSKKAALAIDGDADAGIIAAALGYVVGVFLFFWVRARIN
ncbi:hypothetical protein ACJIZ3_017768 [Penstemon smallii]|uniref:Leucine-rich repeat-containing N-terminal plant-type domain-containing protein n=1 Tax=Penstemon smallii TaxID=265156 RepID=A0ABD3SWG4_9LAMI